MQIVFSSVQELCCSDWNLSRFGKAGFYRCDSRDSLTLIWIKHRDPGFVCDRSWITILSLCVPMRFFMFINFPLEFCVESHRLARPTEFDEGKLVAQAVCWCHFFPSSKSGTILFCSWSQIGDGGRVPPDTGHFSTFFEVKNSVVGSWRNQKLWYRQKKKSTSEH